MFLHRQFGLQISTLVIFIVPLNDIDMLFPDFTVSGNRMGPLLSRILDENVNPM